MRSPFRKKHPITRSEVIEALDANILRDHSRILELIDKRRRENGQSAVERNSLLSNPVKAVREILADLFMDAHVNFRLEDTLETLESEQKVERGLSLPGVDNFLKESRHGQAAYYYFRPREVEAEHAPRLRLVGRDETAA